MCPTCGAMTTILCLVGMVITAALAVAAITILQSLNKPQNRNYETKGG